MLLLLDGHPRDKWSDGDLERWVAVQRAVLRHRAAELDVATDRARAGQALLDGVIAGGQKWLGVAPSTAHVSVVDIDGFACSVTASSGYGAGVSIPGTGVWLNNALGEHELNRNGLHSLAPGERLASNMAPSVARRPDGAVLAIGSPGADRVPPALAPVVARVARHRQPGRPPDHDRPGAGDRLVRARRLRPAGRGRPPARAPVPFPGRGR